MKFREIIVKSINTEAGNYTNIDDETKSFKPLDIYLVPKQDGSHDRYVADEEGVVSKQSIENHDTLNDTVNRGNSTTKNEIILASKQGRAGSIGINETTYSYYIGNLNNTHTGVYNHGFGYNALGAVTTGQNNIALGSWSGRLVSTGQNNTLVGVSNSTSLTTGAHNAILGFGTADSLTTGFKNSYVGNHAGNNTTTGNLNTFIGYKAANDKNWGDKNILIGANVAQGATGNNNILIGVGAGVNGGNLNDKLIIHSNHSLSGYTTNSEGNFITPQLSYLGNALITGDFREKWLKFNATLIVNGLINAQSDLTFSKSLVAKTDGTFGIIDRTEEIPLSGTITGKNVTGAIAYEAPTIFTSKWENIEAKSYAYLSQDEGLYQSRNDVRSQLQSDSLSIMDAKTSGASLDLNINYGIRAEKQFPPQNAHYYIQKGYLDQKLSYSNQEQVTGGEWIDGKPIYRKTIKFEDIPSNGEIDLTTYFRDIGNIVSNQMFTEWYAMDVAFAGNQYRGKAFITLLPEMVKIEYISGNDYDYSLINSFTLTLEYTKKTD